MAYLLTTLLNTCNPFINNEALAQQAANLTLDMAHPLVQRKGSDWEAGAQMQNNLCSLTSLYKSI